MDTASTHTPTPPPSLPHCEAPGETHGSACLWDREKRSWAKQTPNTVTPVSFTSMAQVPRDRLSSRQQGDTVGGTHDPMPLGATLLE